MTVARQPALRKTTEGLGDVGKPDASPGNGLAKEVVSGLVVRNQLLAMAENARFRALELLFGNSCSPNCSPILLDFCKCADVFSQQS